MTGVFLVVGLVFGFVSLWLGPLGLIEAVIILGLVFWQVRRYPERAGAYLFGLSVLPIAFLWAIVARLPVCGPHPAAGAACYTPVTVLALIGYAIAGLVGAALLGISLRRILGARSAST